MVLNGTQWQPMLPSGTRWYLMVANGTHWYPMVPIGTKWFSMILYDTQWYQMVPNGIKWLPMVPNCTQWYQILPNGTQWYHTSDVFVPVDLTITKLSQHNIANQNISKAWKLTHLVPRTCLF